MLLLFTIRVAEDHLFEKELIIRYTMCFLCGRSSVCVCASIPFDFEGGIWDLLVIVPLLTMFGIPPFLKVCFVCVCVCVYAWMRVCTDCYVIR